jgi:hypothetical protein
MIDLTSIETSACCAENSGVLALSSCLGCLVDSDFFGPSSNWRERQCKFLSDWQQVYCVLTNIYGNTTAEQKNVDSFKMSVTHLKVYEVDSWWRIVEIYVIYSIALVEMIMLRLRLMATYPPAGRSIDKSEPTYNVDNSGILAKEALTYSLVICNNTESITAEQKNIVIVQRSC